MKPPVACFFILALLAFILEPYLFPSTHIFAFAPFLAIAHQRTPFFSSLWLAAFCGLIFDLLSSDTQFGAFALCYVLTAACTYRFRHHFFEENLFSIPLYTALISFLLSLFQFLFILPLLTLSFSFVFTSFFIMPIVDGLYAFCWFTCPLFLYNLTNQRRKMFS